MNLAGDWVRKKIGERERDGARGWKRRTSEREESSRAYASRQFPVPVVGTLLFFDCLRLIGNNRLRRLDHRVLSFLIAKKRVYRRFTAGFKPRA